MVIEGYEWLDEALFEGFRTAMKQSIRSCTYMNRSVQRLSSWEPWKRPSLRKMRVTMKRKGLCQMNANETLIDMLEDNRRRVIRALNTMTDACLDWKPEIGANNILITLWHMGRILDVFLTRQARGLEAENECWFRLGWVEQTGYDPRGKGQNGWGMLTGYTKEDVAAMPSLARQQVMGYLNEVYDSVIEFLAQTPEKELFLPGAGFEGRYSQYQCIQMALLDNVRHLGEMFAIKSSWDRHNAGAGLSKEITIREMTEMDPAIISSAFTAQGWNKPASLYERYLQESKDRKRVNLVAEYEGQFAGYVTIIWESDYPPFSQAGIPEIVDFNVLTKYRRTKIGTALMNEAERWIATRSTLAGLSVCLHSDYGAAQALYARRGYIPDGRGAFCNGIYPRYEQVRLDDELGLYMTKQLRPER
jgi:GNAT superfamily N-acetyltransferase